MTDADLGRHFSGSYQSAREKFLAAAKRLNGVVQSHLHPRHRGVDGEDLATDVARLGPHNARSLLIVSSGMHGVEGYCGSGCQLALMHDDELLERLTSSSTALLLIHAVNPYGFSHVRRTNEDNIDLPVDVRLREIAFFSLAGAHTSIHTLSHALHEIFCWCAVHPADAARASTDALFLQRCVHESIRLHPSSQVAMRRALCPVHLPDGEAPTGTEVAIDLEAANRDVSVFGSDAALFNPHRTLPRGVPPYGLSFGLGMHACVGLTLAAGVLQKAEAGSGTHHLGTVALIVSELLRHGARADPQAPPRKDPATTRDLWASYPLLLTTPCTFTR